MKRLRRAVTLPELLVYTVVVALLLGAVYAAFYTSWRYYQAATAASVAEQQALTGTSAVDQALDGCLMNSLTVGTAPPSILFLSAENDGKPFTVDNSGKIVLRRWVCIYLDKASGQLVRKDEVLATPSDQIPTTTPTISGLIADTHLSSRILARGATAASFASAAAANGVDTELTYSLTCRASSPRLGADSVTIEGRALLRNRERS